MNFIFRWSKRKLTQYKNDEQNLIVDTAQFDYEKTCLNLLKNLIDQPEFHIRDGLNEYDEDYTFFENRGNLITREMGRFLARQQEKDITLSNSRIPLDREGELVEETKIVGGKDCDKESDSKHKTNL